MKDINKNIESANNWLKENRLNCDKITLNDVKNRLQKSNFLSLESTKLRKGEKLGYYSAILYLAPHKIVGYNFCPMAINCIKDCIFETGRGRFNNVTRARIIKTLCFLYDRDKFIYHIDKDIVRLNKKAKKDNYDFSVRLNGTSDINIQFYFKNTLNKFKNIQFYDYTKVSSYIFKNNFKNYYLLFSYDGKNEIMTDKLLNLGFSASIVFKNNIPSYYKGYKCIDGDISDLRFLDDKNVIVALKYKNANNENINFDFVIDN